MWNLYYLPIVHQQSSPTIYVTDPYNVLQNPPQELSLDDIKLQRLLNILLQNLYIDPLIKYESSIIFQAIEESCSRLTFSLEIPKTFIFFFHSNAYKMFFVLTNPTPQILHLEDKAVAVIISCVKHLVTPMANRYVEVIIWQTCSKNITNFNI